MTKPILFAHVSKTMSRFSQPHECKRHGVTLVEMSMVLVVIGLIILTIFPALNAIRTSSQRSLTDSNLQSLLRATAVYVQANGCLPCPTPATTTGDRFGYIRGDTNTNACGNCVEAEGIPPFASLGIPAAMAHDGWGRWITMRITPTLANPPSVTLPTERLASLCASTAADDIQVLTPPSTRQNVSAIFVSHGSNGFGALKTSAISNGSNKVQRIDFPNKLAPTCENVAERQEERCNANGGSQFKIADPSNSFDDILLYMNRDNIVSLFSNSSCTGRL